MTAGLAALSVRHRTEILRELRELRAERGLTFDGAVRIVSDLTGDSELVLRESSLRLLGDRLRAQYTDARKALRCLAELDRRFAIWGACACARESLRYVPEGEERPLRAIETTERWLVGQAELDEARESRRGAWSVWSASAYAAADSAVDSAPDAAAAAAYAASAAAYAAAGRRDAPAWSSVKMLRLVGVIADALPRLPPEVL